MPGYDKDTNPNFRPSRSDKKTVVFYTTREKSDQLRHLAINQNTTLQALCELATDELLAKPESYWNALKKKKAVG